MTTTTEPRIYTDSEAADEAVLLITRKLHRLHPEAFADVMSKLPEGAKTALRFAENRADRLRDTGEKYRYKTDDEWYGTSDED